MQVQEQLTEILWILVRVERKVDRLMAALDNLQAADAALKAEVTSFLADIAAKLAAADSANDPAIQAVADDINAQVAALQSSDPAAPAGTDDGSTVTSDQPAS